MKIMNLCFCEILMCIECTFLAEMMEKYGLEVLRDIAVELQFDPETWRDDAEGKRLRYEIYAKRFLEWFKEAAYGLPASCESGMYTYDRAFKKYVKTGNT
ncbi:MAG: hypothetical protein PUE21_03040 [Lachnospiraceae bacterium]|nr:hypothetical protein [Lachnospiraceae bacterium]